MHQLTIEPTCAPVTITAHPCFDEAHRTLLNYAIDADYYLWTTTCADLHTHYQLMALPDPDDPQRPRHPRITGAATIETLPDSPSPSQRPPLAQTGPGVTPP